MQLVPTGESRPLDSVENDSLPRLKWFVEQGKRFPGALTEGKDVFVGHGLHGNDVPAPNAFAISIVFKGIRIAQFIQRYDGTLLILEFSIVQNDSPDLVVRAIERGAKCFVHEYAQTQMTRAIMKMASILESVPITPVPEQ